MKRIGEIIEKMFDQKVSVLAFSLTFISVIFLRVFIEQFIARALPLSFSEVIIEFIHNLYFFLISFVLLWLFTAWLLSMNPSGLAGVFTWASLLILFPPLLDMLKTWGEVFWSFYIISSWGDLQMQFFTIFGHLPSGIVYFGTRIIFIAAILFLAAVVYFRTKNVLKTAVSAVVSYTLLFLMGSFPTIFSFAYYVFWEGKKLRDIQAFQVAQLFGSPTGVWGIQSLGIKYSFAYKLELVYFPLLIFFLAVMFYRINPKKFLAVLKNFRYPQLMYHAGLLFIGMGLGYLNFRENFSVNIFSLASVAVLLMSVWLAWKASVVVNDLADVGIDRISNPNRPLPKGVFSESDYAQFGAICFLLSLLGAVTVGVKFLLLLFIYQILAWFYSSPPFRLKKYPIVASAVSSLASLTILFLGYILLSSDQSIQRISWRITLLLFIAYTISIPIKDFKDVEGDKKYHIWTIPVLLGDKNGRLAIGTGLFISYMLSVFFLNELKLFWWALIFGIISFLIIKSEKINPPRLPWWILGTVTVYLLILIKIVFVDNLPYFLMR